MGRALWCEIGGNWQSHLVGGQMTQLGTQVAGSLFRYTVGTWTDRVRSGSGPCSPGSSFYLGREVGRDGMCVCV